MQPSVLSVSQEDLKSQIYRVMSGYLHAHPFPNRNLSIIDYVKPAKKSKRGKGSKSVEPGARSLPSPEQNDLRDISQPRSTTPKQKAQHDGAVIDTPPPARMPFIFQPSPPRIANPRRPLYLINSETGELIQIPQWVACFHPRIPPLSPNKSWESPIPKYKSVAHAIEIRNALTQFHLAIHLADEEARGDDIRFRTILAHLCEKHMPKIDELEIVSARGPF